MEVSGSIQNRLPTFFKISSLMFPQQKESHTSLEWYDRILILG